MARVGDRVALIAAAGMVAGWWRAAWCSGGEADRRWGVLAARLAFSLGCRGRVGPAPGFRWVGRTVGPLPWCWAAGRVRYSVRRSVVLNAGCCVGVVVGRR